MKIQRKPFRVETKRGTSRSAFISQSQEPDVFRKAEAKLFGTLKPSDSDPTVSTTKDEVPPRRVLLAIEEPQAPLLPSSYDAPARRGRKPGSKNKPKALDALIRGDAEIGVEGGQEAPKRRGRPPGSKNGMRAPSPSEILISPSATSPEPWEGYLDEGGPLTTLEPSLPRRRGRPPGSRNKPKDPLAIPLSKNDRNALDAVGVTADELIVVTGSTDDRNPHPETGDDGAEMAEPRIEQPKRVRLRDRSKILKRYVLGTEIGAGERGYRWGRHSQ